MSKNVAVFVDVANIFYAAKAAGIDIDYVTLLKSATANRDFVRAYAYTGLDPENENQRQFHAFLARSGYKVVSKDIRKYGDGRMKANLDIELVVDMMRMAEKIDVAVVVSGDGDFAPAIAAVQQQGVRVEVVSFRGNTSSDLIDVADTFIDITGVAKVEKGARSGRRVAAEGDLSMTAVPEKESGVTPRRRRRGETEDVERPERAARTRRRGGRPSEEVAERPVAEHPVAAASLVALPGEKLSRGAEPVDVPVEDEEDRATAWADDEPGDEEGGRRRRRRRGGRGRGRGVRGPEEPLAPDDEIGPSELPDEVATLPQHSGFGSVWDRQIGMPAGTTAGMSGATRTRDEDWVEGDEIEDEPEVPEYLLSEKKQGRRRGGRGRTGRTGGYRSALDRERFGAGYSRAPGRDRGRPAGPARASAHAMRPIEQTPSGDPWSEVPPEVQELLRAELARREAGPRAAPAPTAAAPAEDAPAKRATRRRTSTKAAAPEAAAPEAAPAAEPVEDAPAKRTTRRRTSTKAAAPEAAASAAPAEDAPAKRTRRTSTKAAAPEAAAPEAAASAAPAKRTRRTSTKAAAPEAAPADEA